MTNLIRCYHFFLKISCRGQKHKHDMSITCTKDDDDNFWRKNGSTVSTGEYSNMHPNHKHFTCSHLYPIGCIDYTILLHLYAPNRATVKPFFVSKIFFLILSHDGNVLYGFCSFRTNISSYQKRSTKNGPKFFLAMRPRRFSCKYLQKMRRKWQEHSLREFKNARTLSK